MLSSYHDSDEPTVNLDHAELVVVVVVVYAETSAHRAARRSLVGIDRLNTLRWGRWLPRPAHDAGD
jgi:hypothetical protein